MQSTVYPYSAFSTLSTFVKISSKTDNIIAIATPPGSGGIGVIKLSGPDSISIALSVFRFSGGLLLNEAIIESHRMYHGHIFDRSTNIVIDEVLLVVMKTPHSYTGENVAEIQAHGSQAVLQVLLNSILSLPDFTIRLADPGEFTKRAFLNRKIDLTKAEAVIDMINAKTEQALSIASKQLTGFFKKYIETISNDLLQIVAEVEASIDFPEEVENLDMTSILKPLQNVETKLVESIQNYNQGSVYRDGIQAVIVGRPNVGKSSLMNCLLKKNRSIVTNIPGTTRDVIEDSTDISGIHILFADTAGLHNSDDPIEIAGMGLTKERIESADIILFVLDISCPFTDDDYNIFQNISHKKVIILLNKIDLLFGDRNIDEISIEGVLNLPLHWKNAIPISAIRDKGIDKLRKTIFEKITGKSNIESNLPAFVPNLRHKKAIETALILVKKALHLIETNAFEPDIIIIDIKNAMDSIGEIVGSVYTEDILDKIFSQFCIGK